MPSIEPNPQPKTALILVDVTNSFFLAGMPKFLSGIRRGAGAAARASRSGAERRTHCRPRGRAALPGIRRLRMAQAPAPSFYRRQGCRILRGIRARRHTRNCLREASVQRVFRHRPCALLARTGCGARGHRRGEDERLHRATVQDAFANGFDAVVPREATNSNRPHLAEASLEDIQRYFGEVVPLERALEMLG
jgi:maleamate amidohydrolase